MGRVKTQDPPRAKRDPKHREKRTGDGPVLRGEALQLEICRLREIHDEDGEPVHSFAAIAELVGCSRAYAAKVCGKVEMEDDGRFPPAVFEALLAHLRSGNRGDPLAIPGVADVFPVKDESAAPEVAAQRKRDSLRRWISYGRDAEEGSQKRDLWLARQDGRQRAREAKDAA